MPPRNFKHFNPVIFGWPEAYGNLFKCIFGQEIWKCYQKKSEKIFCMISKINVWFSNKNFWFIIRLRSCSESSWESAGICSAININNCRGRRIFSASWPLARLAGRRGTRALRLQQTKNPLLQLLIFMTGKITTGSCKMILNYSEDWTGYIFHKSKIKISKPNFFSISN